MAECRNFFDDSSSSRSSSLAHRPSPPPAHEGDDQGAHSLELTLGLGFSSHASASSSLHPAMVRPVAVYPHLHRHPSGSLAMLPASGSLTEMAQSPVEVSKVQSVVATAQADVSNLPKQHSGNFAMSVSAGSGGELASTFGGHTDTAMAVKSLFSSVFPSRDQIWQTLKRNGTVSGQVTVHADGMKSLDDETSSLWSRRAASMQGMVSVKEMDDPDVQKIRRSCSNGVLQYNLSRQVSSIESSLERSPQRNVMLLQFQRHHQQQEGLEELQKRKEMQAQRRQEARKRRKILIEEKQHKKARQNNGLQSHSSRLSVSPNDRLSWVENPAIENDVPLVAYSAQCGLRKAIKPDDHRVKQQGKGDDGRHLLHLQDGKDSETASAVDDSNHVGDDIHVRGTANANTFTIENGISGSSDGGPVEKVEEVGKSSPSSDAENVSGQNDVSELESSSQKSTVENVSVEATVPSPYSSAATTGSFPRLPLVSFPFSYPVTCSTSLPLFTQCSSELEVKRENGEKSAFTPLWRMASNIRQAIEEPHRAVVRQNSLTASQLSSSSCGVPDSSSNKAFNIERQQSKPFIGRLLSQNSCMHDPSIISPEQEGPSLGSGLDGRRETCTHFCALRPNIAEAKQEEGTSESQLAGEHSDLDVSHIKSLSGALEKQRSRSFPDLPSVTTTGKGPNGKTINGVMYIVNGRQVRLVCSCHGTHMSPIEFVEHSGSTDLSNPERSIVVSPFQYQNHCITSTLV